MSGPNTTKYLLSLTQDRIIIREKLLFVLFIIVVIIIIIIIIICLFVFNKIFFEMFVVVWKGRGVEEEIREEQKE